MNITFHGAAKQVTGSMYEVLVNGFRILVDCGLNYEPDFPRDENANFPFEPEEIDAVVLTHAHLDHSGNIPTLYRKGYKGKVFCTEATWTLCELLLTDSASLEAARTKSARKSKKNVSRLYGHGNVLDAVNSMITMPFHEPFKIADGVKIKFLPAGHILGAASVEITDTTCNPPKKVIFTGDLGNKGSALVVDPEPGSNVDAMIMEGTYGSRFHNDTGNGEEVLKRYILETCVEQRGRLIIPAFSVGRTQSILFTLNQLFKSNKLPRITVFADSPMGITSSEIHADYKNYLNNEASNFLQEYHDLFRFKELYIIEDKDDMSYMEHYTEPYIIVSSAGMLEGGRIQRHIKFNLMNPKCTILMAGYCTPKTLGHKLLSGEKQVRVQGKELSVFARIASTDAFSAHPDQKGLLEYFTSVYKSSPKLKTFLTHGDPESLQTLKTVLNSISPSIAIPDIGDQITV